MIKFLRKKYPEILSITILLALIGYYVYLILKTFYLDGNGNIRTAIAGYGDIPLHLTQITKFAFTKWNLEEPIFAGFKLQYPFLINFLSGLTLKITGWWRFSFLWPPILCVTISAVLVFLIYKKFLKNSLIAIIALIVYYFGSGMGAYKYLSQSFNFRETINILNEKAISTITKWDARYPDQNIDYGAPITLTIHQRPFFLGFLLFLIIVMACFKIKEGSKSRAPIIIGALAYGLLPIAHMHSFLAASIFLASVFLLLIIWRQRQIIKKIVIIIGAGFILALPQIYYLVLHKDVFGEKAHFIAYRLGWMSEPTIGSVKFLYHQTIFSLAYLKFLWVNFGVILVFFIVITLLFLSAKQVKKLFNKKELFILGLNLFCGWLLFLAVMLFRFQPWDYDNNKILVYWQFFAILAIFLFWVKLFVFKKILASIILPLFIVAAIFSGIFDQIFRIYQPFNKMPVIFSVESLKLAEYVKENITEGDLILTGNSHLNPIASLTGRPVLEGFPGWLWTRGINYHQREEDIRNYYQNPEKYDQIIDKYQIKYILLDDQVRYDFGADLGVFQQLYPEVFNQNQYHLFKIKFE